MVDDLILFGTETTVFTGDRIGILSDAIGPLVTEELNGIFELTFEYPRTGILYDEIQNGRIVYTKPNPYAGGQAFRIYNTSLSLGGNLRVSAQHISYDMGGKILLPQSEDVTGTDGTILRYKTSASSLKGEDHFDEEGQIVHAPGVVEIINKNMYPRTVHGVNFTVALPSSTEEGYWENNPTYEFKVEDTVNVRSLMGDSSAGMINMFKGYWDYDNFTVYFRKSRGIDRGAAIVYASNMTELQLDKTLSLPYSHIMPYYKSGGDLIYISDGSASDQTTPEAARLINIRTDGGTLVTNILPLDLTEEVTTKLKTNAVDIDSSIIAIPMLWVLLFDPKSSNEGKTYVLSHSIDETKWPNGKYVVRRQNGFFFKPTFKFPLIENPTSDDETIEYMDLLEIVSMMNVGVTVYLPAGFKYYTYYLNPGNPNNVMVAVDKSGWYIKQAGNYGKNQFSIFQSYPASGMSMTRINLFDNEASGITSDDWFDEHRITIEETPVPDANGNDWIPSDADLEDATTRRNYIHCCRLFVDEDYASHCAWACIFHYQKIAESDADYDTIQAALHSCTTEYIQKNGTGGKVDVQTAFYDEDGINTQDIRLGDTIAIIARDTIGADLSVRVTKTVYSPQIGKYTEIETGDPNERPGLDTDLAALGSFVQNGATNQGVAKALTAAMKTISGASGGCVVINNKDEPNNANAVPTQILVMDKATEATANYMWRWNHMGLCAGQKNANTGEWHYGIAMTIDGRIVADYIKAGTISGVNLHLHGEDNTGTPHDFYVDGESGLMTIQNGEIHASQWIYPEHGEPYEVPIFDLEADGTINATKGKIGGVTLGDGLLTVETDDHELLFKVGMEKTIDPQTGEVTETPVAYMKSAAVNHLEVKDALGGVLFLADGDSHTVQINGATINNGSIPTAKLDHTDSLKSSNYSAPIGSGVLSQAGTAFDLVNGYFYGKNFGFNGAAMSFKTNDYTAPTGGSHYASKGARFDLDTTSSTTSGLRIRTKSFAIETDTSGNQNVFIKGHIEATSGTIGGCEISADGKMYVPSAQITGTISANGLEISTTGASPVTVFKAIAGDGSNPIVFAQTPNYDGNGTATYAEEGIKYDFVAGTIKGKNFAIDAAGNAHYAGSVTAGQISSGYISADRIESGSITAAKLDATDTFTMSLSTNDILVQAIKTVQGETVRQTIFAVNSGSEPYVQIFGNQITGWDPEDALFKVKVDRENVASSNYQATPSSDIQTSGPFSTYGSSINLASGYIDTPFFTVLPEDVTYQKTGGTTFTMPAGVYIKGAMRVYGANKIISTNYIQNDADWKSGAQVTEITESTIQTTNVVAQNLQVKMANVTGALTVTQPNTSNVLFSADVSTGLVKVGGFTASNYSVGSVMQYNLHAGNKVYYADANAGVYLGTNGIEVSDGNSHYIRLDPSTGSLTCNNIQATGGAIGGWTVGNNLLSSYKVNSPWTATANTEMFALTTRNDIKHSGLGSSRSLKMFTGVYGHAGTSGYSDIEAFLAAKKSDLSDYVRFAIDNRGAALMAEANISGNVSAGNFAKGLAMSFLPDGLYIGGRPTSGSIVRGMLLRIEFNTTAQTMQLVARRASYDNGQWSYASGDTTAERTIITSFSIPSGGESHAGTSPIVKPSDNSAIL